MKATRHNGRSGKHGTYDAKHNDRRFDVENSEHIDAERTKMNVYWDCYQGYSLPNDENERAKFTFTEVEKAYYVEKYSDHVDGQNERNRKARHYDRVKTIDGILENNKTCPEETLLQLGNIDGTVSADVLAQISAEYFEEFNRRYGSHVHILDWALHLDEATPHIHERQVFDAVNQYGELCPQQDKALEELGFELPKPNEKKGKYNNRKMVFDEECRKLFISICQKHGLDIDVEPVFGGASYLEKQDFIIMNQQKRIDEKQAVLDGLMMKIEDVNVVVEEAVDLAYEKACEVVTERVKEETVKHAKHDRAEFVRVVQEAQSSQQTAEVRKQRTRLATAKQRVSELEVLLCKIYEDNILGKLSDSRYATLDAQYEKEQSELTAEISALEKAVKSYEKHEKDADRFIALIDKYENFDKLTIAMLNEFIEKILVHERDRKGSIQTTQEVEIYFNFVGRFVPPAFGEVELTPEELEEIRKREERKDRLHQNYLKRKASGAQKRYEDKIKGRKKAEIEAKKAAIRAEDIAKGVFVPVSSLPQREPMKGVQTA